MIPAATLEHLAREHLRDAQVLHAQGRHDGAVHLCGYALEMSLKARITKHLAWKGFPETRKEFDGFHSLRVHDLDVLLAFSGQEAMVKAGLLTEWSAVVTWDPEVRYKPPGTATAADTEAMIKAAETLVKTLCP